MRVDAALATLGKYSHAVLVVPDDSYPLSVATAFMGFTVVKSRGSTVA